jgi:hypothetical protein
MLLCGWYHAISYLARVTRLAPKPGSPTISPPLSGRDPDARITRLHDLLVAVGDLVAGALNTIAGGGSFIALAGAHVLASRRWPHSATVWPPPARRAALPTATARAHGRCAAGGPAVLLIAGRCPVRRAFTDGAQVPRRRGSRPRLAKGHPGRGRGGCGLCWLVAHADQLDTSVPAGCSILGWRKLHLVRVSVGAQTAPRRISKRPLLGRRRGTRSRQQAEAAPNGRCLAREGGRASRGHERTGPGTVHLGAPAVAAGRAGGGVRRR